MGFFKYKFHWFFKFKIKEKNIQRVHLDLQAGEHAADYAQVCFIFEIKIFKKFLNFSKNSDRRQRQAERAAAAHTTTTRPGRSDHKGAKLPEVSRGALQTGVCFNIKIKI